MATTSKLLTKLNTEALNNPVVPWTTSEGAVEVITDAIVAGTVADTAIGTTVDTPSTSVEDTTARTGISLWKGIKNYLRDLAANVAVVSGATDAGNAVKVGGRYNTTQPTLTNGQRGNLELDSRGRAMTVCAGVVSPSDSYTNASSFAGFFERNGSGAGNPAWSAGSIFNDTTWDRARGNTTTVLLASAARTTTQTSTAITNYNGRGIHWTIDVTSITDTPILTPSIQEQDANGIYYTIFTGTAISTVSSNFMEMYPGATVAAGTVASRALGRTFRLVITATDADSATYSSAYSIIL